MLILGYGSGYIVQGGDVGSKVARVMAAKHEECKGKHLHPASEALLIVCSYSQ